MEGGRKGGRCKSSPFWVHPIVSPIWAILQMMIKAQLHYSACGFVQAVTASLFILLWRQSCLYTLLLVSLLGAWEWKSCLEWLNQEANAVLCLSAIPIWWARPSQVDLQLRAERSLCTLQRREAWGLPLKAQSQLPREREAFPQQPESLLLAHRVPLGLRKARPSWILLSQLLGCNWGESLLLL